VPLIEKSYITENIKVQRLGVDTNDHKRSAKIRSEFHKKNVKVWEGVWEIDLVVLRPV